MVKTDNNGSQGEDSLDLYHYLKTIYINVSTL